MSEQDGKQRPGRVRIENVNHPGSTSTVDRGMYHTMRDALLNVLPTKAPGLTQAEMQDAVVPRLPEDLFPGGAKAGWWSKAVQLDLEAKGVIAREFLQAIALASQPGVVGRRRCQPFVDYATERRSPPGWPWHPGS